MSSLTITPVPPPQAAGQPQATGQPQTYSASDIVSVLWEATKAATTSAPGRGAGTPQQPYQPCTAAEWLWIASNKAGQDTHLEIGGRRIFWRGSDKYIIDEGAVKGSGTFTVPTLKELAYKALDKQQSIHPAAPFIGTKDPDSRFGSQDGASYPEMYLKLKEDFPKLDEEAVCGQVAGQVRLLLAGARSMAKDTSCKALPALTAAWFLAEVSRNPTSFATGLMLLDLMEAGVKYSGPDGTQHRYTWEKALWHPEVFETERRYFEYLKEHPLVAVKEDTTLSIPAGVNLAAEHKQAAEFRMLKEQAKDAPAAQILMDSKFDPGRGGIMVTTRDSRGGDHPMAHGGSVKQSAVPKGKGNVSLSPTTEETLSIVRQKEALIVNRWLAYCVTAPGATVSASSALLAAAPGSSKLGEKMYEEPTSGKARQRAAAFSDANPVLTGALKVAITARLGNLVAMKKQ
jgi:hypothetical protein